MSFPSLNPFKMAQNGYSLTELMIVVGLTSVLAVFGNQILLNSSKIVATTSHKTQSGSSWGTVITSLSNPDLCSSAFYGFSSTSPDFRNGIQIDPKFKSPYTTTPNRTSTLIPGLNQKMNDATVTAINLTSVSTPSSYQLSVTVQPQNNADGSTPPPIIQTMNLQLNVVSETITSCLSAPPPNANTINELLGFDSSTLSNLCRSNLKGTWIPTTNTCALQPLSGNSTQPAIGASSCSSLDPSATFSNSVCQLQSGDDSKACTSAGGQPYNAGTSCVFTAPTCPQGWHPDGNASYDSQTFTFQNQQANSRCTAGSGTCQTSSQAFSQTSAPTCTAYLLVSTGMGGNSGQCQWTTCNPANNNKCYVYTRTAPITTIGCSKY